MRTTMKIAAALLFLGGCAAPAPQAPSPDGGAVIGEVGDPRHRARIHTELAAAYLERGNLGVALEELRIATAADNSYAPAHSMFGLVYMELRDPKLAEQSFERALRLAPGDGDINHNYGWFLCQTKREPESLKYFQQAIRNPLYATPWRSHSAAGVCALRTASAKDAEQSFEHALRLEPDDPVSLLNLAQIRYRQGRIEDARRLVGRYNKVADPSPESLWLAVRIERRAGQRVAEQSYANQLRRRYPGSPEHQALQRGSFD